MLFNSRLNSRLFNSRLSKARIAFAVLTASLALLTACDRPIDFSAFNSESGQPRPASAAPAPPPPSPAAQPKTPDSPKTGASDHFQQGLNRAFTAATMAQSAQSRDDWRLVSRRWQQAIELMSAVPASSPHRAQAIRKATEYRRNWAIAQQYASRSSDTASTGVPNLAIAPGAKRETTTEQISSRATAVQPDSTQVSAAEPSPTRTTQRERVFYAPIIRRAGSTPVVRVTFNGNQSFDMIVDTGASGTLITQEMATALNIVPVSQTSVDTASARGVTLPLGYANSIEVGGITVRNVLVAIAGQELSLGLLGHDFFGHYDVTIRENQVEFQERG